MTEQILNSLYIKNMFLFMNANEIFISLETKQDKVNFIDGILFIIKNSLFFNIDNERNVKLQAVCNKIYASEEWNKDFIKALDLISTKCTEFIEQKEEAKDYQLISYGTSESKKRNLITGSICVPSPSEVEQYIYSDYVIINSVVKKQEIPEEFNTDKVISAISLIINSYSSLLYENPKSEDALYDYLRGYDVHSLKNRVFNRKDLKRIKALYSSLVDYDLTKELEEQVRKELSQEGYMIQKNY